MDISGIENIKYEEIPLGVQIRKQLNHEWIFRVRPGNGNFGTVKGRSYQDKYAYFVPDSINNVQSEPYRVLLSLAVAYWKNELSEEQKQEYNTKANEIGGLSGYNLFVREVIKGDFIIPE